ncbi:hypothetical protein OAC91_03360 [Candidatus Marinimicrobia bacterium]|nr:hypothetical protein [Candidatus Neomarinimicrobiota bacterium]
MSQKRKAILKKKSFFKEYNFEITVVTLITLGLFLIVEDLEIKSYIFLFFKKIAIFSSQIILTVTQTIFFFFQRFEFSDIVGIGLIAFALYLIARRWRERVIQRASIFKDCPECGSELHRIKKEAKHKLLGYLYFSTIKNYGCKKCTYKNIKFSNR